MRLILKLLIVAIVCGVSNAFWGAEESPVVKAIRKQLESEFSSKCQAQIKNNYAKADTDQLQALFVVSY